MLVLPVIFSILAMSPVMAALKPYCQEKITTGAFDYFPYTINTLYDAQGNDINIYYLEYGRANSQVTETWIYGNPSAPVFYQGKLYFYAKGSYLPDPEKLIAKPWAVTLISNGNIDCESFGHQYMECKAMGTYSVQYAPAGGKVPVCIEYIAYGPDYLGSERDKIYVKAYKAENGECTTDLYLDAETSCYWGRVPQQHVVFTEWNNFARFPQCKWDMQRDSTPV